MLCLTYFVIALVLPTFAQEEKESDVTKTLVCNDRGVLEAGDNFFRCFNLTVKNSITNMNTSCDTSLPETIFKYMDIANKTCYLDMVNRERDSLEFYKLMMFSMKNMGYQDFVKGGGVECIKAIKEKITRCVKSNLGNVTGADDKYFTLWKKSVVMIDKTICKKANLIKRCTLTAMRSEGWYWCQYNNDNVLYVSSLFDFMLERCTRILPDWETNQNSGVFNNFNSSFWTIFLILPLHWVVKELS